MKKESHNGGDGSRAMKDERIDELRKQIAIYNTLSEELHRLFNSTSGPAGRCSEMEEMPDVRKIKGELVKLEP